MKKYIKIKKKNFQEENAKKNKKIQNSQNPPSKKNENLLRVTGCGYTG